MSSALAAWLLTYLLHSTVAFVLAAIASAVLKSHPVRAAIWKVAIAGPVVTALLAFAWGASVSVERPAAASPAAAPAAARPAAPRPAGTLPAEFDAPPEASPVRLDLDWTDMLIAAWLAGAALLLLRFALQARALRRAAGRERAEPLVPLLAELAARAGVRRPLTLLWSDAVGIPLAIGRATIVVPRRTAALTAAEQRVLLGHELAHLLRRDPQWLTLMAAIESILFFQPLTRMARRHFTEASEFVADETAVQLTSDGISLARCLVNVAAWTRNAGAVHAASMASSRSQLATRVERLLESRASRVSRYAFAAVPLLLAATAAMPAVRLAAPALPVTAPSMTDPAVPARAVDDPLLAIFRDAARREQDNPDPVFNPPARSRWVLEIARGRELVPALIEKLGAAGWIEREHATWALAVVPDRRAVDPLLAALDDEAWRVRGGAASTLGSIGDPRAAPALLPLLGDEHWQVRAGAVSSIGELSSDPAMIDRLRPLLGDPHIAVRNGAERAIEAIEQRLSAR